MNSLVEGEPSFLSSPDPRGAMMYFHVSLTPSGSLSVLHASHDPTGNKFEIKHFETSRKKLRGALAETSRELGCGVGEAPGSYVGWRIHRAAEAHRAALGTLSPRADYDLSRVPDPQPEPPHPTRGLGPAPEGRLGSEEALAHEPELRYWVPPPRGVQLLNQGLQGYVIGLVEAREKASHRSEEPELETSALRSILKESIDGFYDPLERAALALKLRDLALVFHSTRRRNQALDAVCVADALETGSVPAHELSLVFTMQARAMAMLSRVYKSKRTGGP